MCSSYPTPKTHRKNDDFPFNSSSATELTKQLMVYSKLMCSSRRHLEIRRHQWKGGQNDHLLIQSPSNKNMNGIYREHEGCWLTFLSGSSTSSITSLTLDRWRINQYKFRKTLSVEVTSTISKLYQSKGQSWRQGEALKVVCLKCSMAEGLIYCDFWFSLSIGIANNPRNLL